ncbi:hypothetical protein HanOQP8_Chr14g0533691 [Helianthus annuus]|nr:hypothetical protein HanOQP8_Chr14g0533691 [Helianthus annuus]
MNIEREFVQAVDANMNMLDGKNTNSVEKEADPSVAESEKTGVVNVDDIEHYYFNSGEYGQTQNEREEYGFYIDADGDLRIRVECQYESTQEDTHNDEVHAGILDVFFNQYEECVKRINGTLAEGSVLFPDSERIKEKQKKWDDILMKHARSTRTRSEPQTPVVLSAAKSKSDGGMSTTDLSQWTPTMVAAANEHMDSIERDNTPKGQLVKIFQNEPLDITPLSQKTATKYEFACKRDQVVRQLDMGKRVVRPQRNVELPEALRSPYVERVVDITSRLDAAEASASAYMFSAWGSMWYVKFCILNLFVVKTVKYHICLNTQYHI